MKFENYVLNTNMSHDDYAKLAEAVARENGRPMTDDEVRNYVQRMFGFIHGLIVIKRSAELMLSDGKTNRKTCSCVAREPLYSASDMNYIRFAVCSILYEVVNGHLEFVDE